VARRYGAKLIDLNEGPFEKRDLGDVKVGISKTVLDSEFLINVPVLKSHPQVKVSLGFKNLKGCLDIPSRKSFHLKGLDHMICLLNQLLECKLTIIDGIYMLEKGADTLMGTAHRKDLIIASHDAFACDCIGATVLGIDPSEVVYLKEYAEVYNRPIDISAIQIVGEDMEPLREKAGWIAMAEEELLSFRITGLSVSHPGHNVCSGCYSNLICALGVFAKTNPNKDCGDTRIYWGRKPANGGGGQRMILYGNCAISKNRDKEHAVRIAGCPPKMINTLLTLMRTLLSRPRMVKVLLLRIPHLVAWRMGLYSGNLPKWKRYQAPEFDSGHFRWTLRQSVSNAFRKSRR
jgi:hypothetical protein